MTKGWDIYTYEPAHFYIKKEAMPAWHKLSKAMEQNPFYPCNNNPYFYTDYDGYGFETEEGHGTKRLLTEDECEALCAGCPLLKQCYDFAVANEEEHGIWGGIDFSVKPDKLF